MELCKQEWEASCGRGDNAIFYPKEEVVKFLNRHVRKRTGLAEFRDILERAPDDRTPWRALDYGCGIGRHAVLLEEFGLEAYGVDLSEKSIALARGLAGHMGFPALGARLRPGSGRTLDFEDDYFDLCIAESCLDCMPFEVARGIVRELDRVTKYLGYVTLYSGDNSEHHREFAGEVRVAEPLACGTVRCFYNWARIGELIGGTAWRIASAHLIEEHSVTRRYRHGRYYVILGKRL
jgi:SAM-dependent methyltransferase